MGMVPPKSLTPRAEPMNLTSPQTATITKRAIKPQSMILLASVLASSLPWAKMNLTSPQKKARSARPTTIGSAVSIKLPKAVNILFRLPSSWAKVSTGASARVARITFFIYLLITVYYLLITNIYIPTRYPYMIRQGINRRNVVIHHTYIIYGKRLVMLCSEGLLHSA